MEAMAKTKTMVLPASPARSRPSTPDPPTLPALNAARQVPAFVRSIFGGSRCLATQCGHLSFVVAEYVVHRNAEPTLPRDPPTA
jgi:hypothetical protein